MVNRAALCAVALMLAVASADPQDSDQDESSDLNFGSSSLVSEAGRIRVAVSYPTGYTNRVDLFVCSDLVKGDWRPALTTNADLSAHRTEWTDPGSSPGSNQFYAAGNADVTPATDPDGDGLPWGRELYLYHTSPTDSDSDADGMSDGWEVAHGLNPLVNDASLDADYDGLLNFQEYQLGADPTKADTHGDEMPDGWEVANGLDPLDRADAAQGDSAGDGFTNLQKHQMGVDSGMSVTSSTFSEQEFKVTTPWRNGL